MSTREGRSAVLACILSLIIPGVGHFYTGSLGKGFAFWIIQLVGAGLVSTIVGAVIGIPILLVNPVWAAIDAYMAAKS